MVLNYIVIIYLIYFLWFENYCCVPTRFCMSTMISIPKGSGSMEDMKTIEALPLVAYCLSCLTHVLYLVNLIVC